MLRRSTAAAALAAAAATGAAGAQPVQWQGQVALASALVDRGLTLLPRRTTLQAEVQAGRGRWSLGAGWSGGFGGHGDDGRLLVRLGRYEPIDEDWQLDAALTWYGYTGDAYARAFDRFEAGLGLGFRDLLSVGLTALDLRGWPGRRGGLQWAVEAGARWPLGEAWSLTASLGRADVPSRPDRRYGYGGVGIAWQSGRWQAELGRLGADGTARRLLGDAARPRWVAGLAAAF